MRSRRLVLTLILIPLLALGLFVLSAATLGSWWRVAFMPTPNEWSAFFGASALIAIGFAWYQIRQVDHSNQELIASNEEMRRVSLEAVRPRVIVELTFHRLVRRDRGAPFQGEIDVVIRNYGAAPARNVALTVNRPFSSLPVFFKEGMMGEHLKEINRHFDGSVSYPALNPGKRYMFFLGRHPTLTDDPDVTRSYTVTATYSDESGRNHFVDTFTLDLDIERRIEAPVDPLERIGKDLEVIGTRLREIKTAIPDELTLSKEGKRQINRPSPLSQRASRAHHQHGGR